MNFKLNNDPNEFDFSINVCEIDGIIDCMPERPYNIDEELFNSLIDTCINKGEYRFVGLIEDNGDFVVHRCYTRNGRVWENVFYDEFVDLIDDIKGYNSFQRIHNCLMY